MTQHDLINDPEFGFMRLEPIPGLERVERLYREEYYAEDYKPFHEAGQKSKERDADYNEPRYRQIFKAAGDRLGDLTGRRMLDLGCGFGGLLRSAQGHGLKAAGCDLSPKAVEYVKERGGECLAANVETDFRPPDRERYDLVTMLCLLQHLRDPARTLFKVRDEWLAEDGVLVVEVPNEFNTFQKVADKEYDLGQWWVSVPEHIAYFTPESLRDLLEGCGYRVFDLYANFPMELFLLMGEVYVGNQDLGGQCHQKRSRFEELMRKHGREEEMMSLYRALAAQGLGRQITMLAVPDPYSKRIEPEIQGD